MPTAVDAIVAALRGTPITGPPAAQAAPPTPQQRSVSMQLPTALAAALMTGRMAGLSDIEQAQVQRIRQQYGNALSYADTAARSDTPYSNFLFQMR